MRKIITTAALAGTLAIGLAGCYAETETTPAGDPPTVTVDTDTETESACVCDAGKAGGTVWCADCGKGYVDGAEKGCQGCVEAKLGGPDCPT